MDLSSIKSLDDLLNVYNVLADVNTKNYHSIGSVSDNSTAFSRWRFLPRHFRNVISNFSMSTEVFDDHVSVPFGISPTACHECCHSSAELGTSKGLSNSTGGIMIVSMWANKRLDDIKKSGASNTRYWAQFSPLRFGQATQKYLKLIENSGYEAIVLTIDCASYIPIQFDCFPFSRRLPNFEDVSPTSNVKNYRETTDLGYTPFHWRRIKELKRITHLKIVIKGVLTVDDALLAAENGADAIIVSNHGARILEQQAVAPIDVLPAIVRAVGDRCEIYMDGGVRSGSDVFIALALGAKYVFLGRPVLWALTLFLIILLELNLDQVGTRPQGSNGVKRLFDLIRMQLEVTMQNMGCASVADIHRDMIVHTSQLPKL